MLLLRFLFPALLLAGPVLAQSALPCAHYATAASSNLWLEQVGRLPVAKQVEALRARMLCDTVLRHAPAYVCLTGVSATNRAIYAQARAQRDQAEAARPAGVFLLYSLGGYVLANNDPANVLAFAQQLEKQPVRRITYLPAGPQAAALFGSRGANGVVLLEPAGD